MNVKNEFSTIIFLGEEIYIQGPLGAQERAALAKLLQMSAPDDSEVEAHQMLPPSMDSYRYIKNYQADINREFQRIHLAEQAMAGKPSFFSKLEIRLGKFMVKMGRNLITRPSKSSTSAAD